MPHSVSMPAGVSSYDSGATGFPTSNTGAAGFPSMAAGSTGVTPSTAGGSIGEEDKYSAFRVIDDPVTEPSKEGKISGTGCIYQIFIIVQSNVSFCYQKSN